MADITLTAVTRTQGCTVALKNGALKNGALRDGTVRAGRFALRFEEVPVLIQAFRRMVRSLEFDVSEMAFTTYLCARAHGKPFTALPIFLVRGFHHGAILRRAAATGLVPGDLEGREVGVNRGYTVTTGVWARGILADEYGVDLSRVTWVLSGDEHVAEYQPPPNVVPAAPGQDVPAMVASGELAAGIGLAPGPGLVPLIPGAEEAGYRALRQRGLYPINHLVVVRDELLSQYPDLARDLFAAYTEAKAQYVGRLRDGRITDPGPADLMYRRVMDITGDDPLPYGIAPNRAMIGELVRHAVGQQILDRPVAAEDLFPESTHDLVG
jgi:4,5-dihydroxyphthalate decarboxylase